VNLLQDQELYDENPAWKPFQPLEPEKKPLVSERGAPPPGGRAGAVVPVVAQAPPPPRYLPPTPQVQYRAPPPTSQYTAPLAQPASPPTPQYAAPLAQPAPITQSAESALAQSLRESVTAQSRMVDDLFHELREIQRKIDQRPGAAPASPAPAPRPPDYHAGAPGFQTPNVPPAADTPRGFPRWAEDADAEERLAAQSEVTLEERPEEVQHAETEHLRQQMRGYIEAVRESLGPSEEPAKPQEPLVTPELRAPAAVSAAAPAVSVPSVLPEGAAKTGALLDYLGKLSEYLPEGEQRKFRASDERLAMESLKSRLSGSPGLVRRISGSAGAPRAKGPLTLIQVRDTLTFLRGLAGWHPDPAIGAALGERIDAVIARMGKAD
jgi:hypothetical protein